MDNLPDSDFSSDWNPIPSLAYICRSMIKTIIVNLLLLGFSQSAAGNHLHHTVNLPDSIVEGKVYQGKATVKKKLFAEKKMIIKHERIEGLMPAMTMAFPVADTLIFDRCAIGSKGLFTLQIEKGFPVIVDAQFDKPPKYVCPMHPHELSNSRGSCPICGMPLEKLSEP
jgi:Cu/Ag efflux protein CusF